MVDDCDLDDRFMRMMEIVEGDRVFNIFPHLHLGGGPLVGTQVATHPSYLLKARQRGEVWKDEEPSSPIAPLQPGESQKRCENNTLAPDRRYNTKTKY